MVDLVVFGSNDTYVGITVPLAQANQENLTNITECMKTDGTNSTLLSDIMNCTGTLSMYFSNGEGEGEATFDGETNNGV